MRVKVSEGNQLSLRADVAEKVGIVPGDTVIIEVRDGVLYLRPEPKDWEKALRGLGKEVWEGIDPVEYVRRERGTWPE